MTNCEILSFYDGKISKEIIEDEIEEGTLSILPFNLEICLYNVVLKISQSEKVKLMTAGHSLFNGFNLRYKSLNIQHSGIIMFCIKPEYILMYASSAMYKPKQLDLPLKPKYCSADCIADILIKYMEIYFV